MAKRFERFDFSKKVPRETKDPITDDVLSAASSRQDTERYKDARLIPIGRIKPDPDQPRKNLKDHDFTELAASIKLHGVIQPIVVQFIERDEVYQIISGERRYQAAKLAGSIDKLPCIIKKPEEASETLSLQLIENLQREDLSPIEKATGLERLKKLLGDNKWNRVEEQTGIQPAHRRRLTSYLDLDDKLKPYATNENYARALMKVRKKPAAAKSIIKAIEANKSGKEVLKIAQSMSNGKAGKRQTQQKHFTIPYIDEEDLLKKLQTKTKDLKAWLKKKV